MNHIAPQPESAIRDIPLCRLALAPENVRKTPPDDFAQTQLQATIEAHGLLENLVARANGGERFTVAAGGRRLAALKTLAEDGTLHADHPVPCKIASAGHAGELSLTENVIRIAMHPADQVVAFSQLAQSGVTVAAIAARFGVTEHLVEQSGCASATPRQNSSMRTGPRTSTSRLCKPSRSPPITPASGRCGSRSRTRATGRAPGR